MGWQTEAVICICVKSIGPGFLVATLHFVIRGLVTQTLRMASNKHYRIPLSAL